MFCYISHLLHLHIHVHVHVEACKQNENFSTTTILQTKESSSCLQIGHQGEGPKIEYSASIIGTHRTSIQTLLTMNNKMLLVYYSKVLAFSVYLRTTETVKSFIVNPNETVLFITNKIWINRHLHSYPQNLIILSFIYCSPSKIQSTSTSQLIMSGK